MTDKPRRVPTRLKEIAASWLQKAQRDKDIPTPCPSGLMEDLAARLHELEKATPRAKRHRLTRVVDLTIWHEEYSDGTTETVLSPGACTAHGQPAMPSLTLVLALLEWAMMAAPDQFAD